MIAPALSRAQLTAGALLLAVNALLYLAAEAIAAAAWRDPVYSYSSNYISDLGVPEVGEFEGRAIDSPLHWVMNTGFVLHGALFIVAVLLLRNLFLDPATRRTIVAMGVLHGVGIALVGLFHGSAQAATDGTVALHGLGALLAIGAGNGTFIAAGTAVLRHRARPGVNIHAIGSEVSSWALV